MVLRKEMMMAKNTDKTTQRENAVKMSEKRHEEKMP